MNPTGCQMEPLLRDQYVADLLEEDQMSCLRGNPSPLYKDVIATGIATYNPSDGKGRGYCKVFYSVV